MHCEPNGGGRFSWREDHDGGFLAFAGITDSTQAHAIIGAVSQTGNGDRGAGATGRRPIALAPVPSAVLSAELILVAGNGRGVSYGSGEGHGDLAVRWRCHYVSGRTRRLQGCALKVKGCAINFEVVDIRGKF